MTTFTASEVRATIEDSLALPLPIKPILHAYADRLEADEKAVPYCYTCEQKNGLAQGAMCRTITECEMSPLYDPEQDHIIPLFTHPAPADAERLAEALRAKIRRLRSMPKGEFQLAASIFADDLERILNAQSAQSAQPQPPAASVPDGFFRHVAQVCRGTVENCRPKASLFPGDPQEHNGGLCLNELTHIAGEIDRMLAAQENPNA